MSVTKKDSSSTDDIPAADSRFCFECMRNIDADGRVDLIGVAMALGYTNTASAGNRFRALSQRYGFGELKCKNSGAPLKDKTPSAAGATGDNSATAKSAAAKPTKKPAARKGAKKSTAEPVPATKGVTAKGKGKAKDSGAEEIKEEVKEEIKEEEEEEDRVSV